MVSGYKLESFQARVFVWFSNFIFPFYKDSRLLLKIDVHEFHLCTCSPSPALCWWRLVLEMEDEGGGSGGVRHQQLRPVLQPQLLQAAHHQKYARVPK